MVNYDQRDGPLGLWQPRCPSLEPHTCQSGAQRMIWPSACIRRDVEARRHQRSGDILASIGPDQLITFVFIPVEDLASLLAINILQTGVFYWYRWSCLVVGIPFELVGGCCGNDKS